jgi:hypothetical protein
VRHASSLTLIGPPPGGATQGDIGNIRHFTQREEIVFDRTRDNAAVILIDPQR